MKFSSMYSNHAKELAGVDCSFESFGSLVRSEFQDECDINRIMDRYISTGVIEHVSNAIPVFSDVSELGDYTTLRLKLNLASNAFMELPAKLRDMMSNDPANFEPFLADPSNRDLLVSYGVFLDGSAKVENQQRGSASSGDSDPATSASEATG